MTKSQLLEEIAETTKAANANLAGWDPKTLPGVTAQKQRAKTKLTEQKSKYQKLISETALVMLTTGDPELQTEFAAIAKEEGNTVNIDAGELYERLAAVVEPTLGGRRIFGSTQLGRMSRELQSVAADLKLSGVPAPAGKAGVVVKDHEALVAHIRKLIGTGLSGVSFMARYLESAIVKAALEIRYSNDVVPVVVTGAEEPVKLGKHLFKGRYKVVAVSKKTATKAGVIAVFKSVKELQKEQ